MTITVVFTPPDKAAGRAAFEAACMDMGDKLNPMCTQINAEAEDINAKAIAAETARGLAADAQAAAEAARDAALAAATAIAADYDPGGHVYAKNALVWDAPGELYRCILGYTSSATRPSADATHWARVNITPADLAAINAAIAALQLDADKLRDVPPVAKTAAYTLALTDRGQGLDTTAGITIPANAAVAFPTGATVLVTNTSASTISITPAAGVTLRLGGTTKAGARTLAGYGVATLRKIGVDTWIIVGAGAA